MLCEVIKQEQNLEQLKQWTKLAARVQSVEEFTETAGIDLIQRRK